MEAGGTIVGGRTGGLDDVNDGGPDPSPLPPGILKAELEVVDVDAVDRKKLVTCFQIQGESDVTGHSGEHWKNIEGDGHMKKV